VFLDLIASVLL